jgi:hypothetical protein
MVSQSNDGSPKAKKQKRRRTGGADNTIKITQKKLKECRSGCIDNVIIITRGAKDNEMGKVHQVSIYPERLEKKNTSSGSLELNQSDHSPITYSMTNLSKNNGNRMSV